MDFYNLDMIISVGYRVNSLRGTQFRIWVTNVLRQHLVQGYTVHAQRLKELNQAVRLVADMVHRRTLSGDEAAALLERWPTTPTRWKCWTTTTTSGCASAKCRPARWRRWTWTKRATSSSAWGSASAPRVCSAGRRTRGRRVRWRR